MVITKAAIERFITMRKNKTHLAITRRNMVATNMVNTVEDLDLVSTDTADMVNVTD